MVDLAANIVSPPLRRGTPANLSGLATRSTLPRLAGYTPLLAPPSGGHGANVSGGAGERQSQTKIDLAALNVLHTNGMFSVLIRPSESQARGVVDQARVFGVLKSNH